MGGVQVTVSWSTDVLVTVMFPTGPGEAGEEGRGGARGVDWLVESIIHNVELTHYHQGITSNNH